MLLNLSCDDFEMLPIPHQIGSNRKHNTIDELGLKIVRNRVFDCHLSPFRRQMAIKNTVPSDFINSVFDCCPFLCEYTRLEKGP